MTARNIKTGEVWESIKGYEGAYQVSNLGRVKSLERLSSCNRRLKEKILKGVVNNWGYPHVVLFKNGKRKTRTIHQLVAESFLNHTPCGFKLVVNHIDFNKSNNNACNLEVITQRENTNLKHISHSSKFTGVSWSKQSNKWQAQIKINGERKHLGYFENEYEAYLKYEKISRNI